MKRNKIQPIKRIIADRNLIFTKIRINFLQNVFKSLIYLTTLFMFSDKLYLRTSTVKFEKKAHGGGGGGGV